MRLQFGGQELTRNSADRSRGTAWRIWDLHVHTPASVVQGYGGDTDEVWERFIADLEALPADIGVIGINDYWFLDGYRRVVAARDAGRLKNLEAVFPVVEMRLDQFGGSDTHLSRVNLHVIFDPEIGADTIEAQFISALRPSARLTPGRDPSLWSGVITRESLKDLGMKIKASLPAERAREYADDFTEGFNNLNVTISNVKEALSSPYFTGRALIGIGKTEWADLRWNDQSIASKKSLINEADLVFTAFEDASRWRAGVDRLRQDNLTHKLLDCSDAHNFSDSTDTMRLGACQTWMNTSPSFAGLAYALEEFDRRVFVGLEPPSLGRVRQAPESYISSVKVSSATSGHDLFDYELPLNSGFVAIVGNKGQGKSALLDCIALAGNSSRNSEFAFLNSSRFLSPSSERKAKQYEATISWASGVQRSVALNAGHDTASQVSVEYLPQAFVERVCSTDPTKDADEFERELRTVLFTHIEEEQRAGEDSFDSLLAQKTQSSKNDLTRLREELRSVVRDYVAASEFRASNRVDDVVARILAKKEEITLAEADLSAAHGVLAASDASGKDSIELSDLRAEAADLNAQRETINAALRLNDQARADLRARLNSVVGLEKQAEALRSAAAQLSAEANEVIGVVDPEYVTVLVNAAALAAWQVANETTLSALQAENAQRAAMLAQVEEMLAENRDRLAAADSERERARQRVLQLTGRVAALKGASSEPGTLLGLEELQERINAAPLRLEGLRVDLLARSEAIHGALSEQMKTVAELYEPASSFIASSDVVTNAGLAFNADLRLLPTWRGISSALDGRRNGDYPDWLENMPSRLAGTTWHDLQPELTTALQSLEGERGDVAGAFRNPSDALRSNYEVDEFIMSILDLSWLDVRFGLTGNGMPLSQLSPGQRGLVLALFYLVVDRRTTPLLLDQPEENLDNETIADKLVPALFEASSRRQTIVVTHNANLAIVGDADQIVHCQMKDEVFSLESGSIAEVDVAQFAMNVLEGTKPAFENRRHKYAAFPQLS